MKTAIKDTTKRQSGQRIDHSTSSWRCIRGGNGIGYSYDPATRRVAEIYTSKRGANSTLLYPIQDLQYLYDPVGDVKGLTNNMYVSFDGKQETVNRSFSYDGFYRLTSSTGHLHDNTLAVGQGTPTVQTDEIRNYSVTTAFNDIHNLTGKTQAIKNVDPYTGNQTVDSQYDFTGPTNGYKYESGKPHFVSSVGGLSFTPDADGNKTGYNIATFQDTGIDWDEEDRMTFWGYFSPGGSRTESYVYNEAGERTVKMYDESFRGGYETMYPNQFYTTTYDTPLYGEEPSYGPTTKNIYVGNQRVAGVIDNTNTFYYHSDHLGSTTYLSDATGAIREHMEYTPWGENWVQQNDVNLPQNYLFTGKEQDATSGLYYFGARYYDPQTSVWMSADPAIPDYLDSMVGGGGIYNSMNLATYSYAHLNPMRYTDPDGRWGVEAAIAADVVLIAAAAIIAEMPKNQDTAGAEAVILSIPGMYLKSQLDTLSTIAKILNAGEGSDAGKKESAAKPAQTTSAAQPPANNDGSNNKGDKNKNKEYDRKGNEIRREPANKQEQDALNKVKSGEGKGRTIIENLKDPRYKPEDGWVKKSYQEGKIEIHYNENNITGEITDVKFKNPPVE